MTPDILVYLHGASTMGCLVIGLVFLKYWRVSRDRFFIFFMSAFWVFALGWGMRAFVPSAGDHGHFVYVPRLLGFLLILAGIFDKNRRSVDESL
jgi:hypothetical protein